jgi:glycosyltransferase involved in cell wall biosynthesis
VRLYDVVRTAHLERGHSGPPATIVFRERRYDFDPELAEGLDLLECPTAWSMVSVLARSGITQLEVNEPLMRAGLVRTVLALAVVRTSAALRRRPVAVVTYAIENKDPFGGPGGGRLRSRVRRWLDRRLSGVVMRSVDRIAYGTPGAQDLYRRRFPGARAEASTVLALSAACDCTGDVAASPDEVLFLGALSARKGLDRLLEAWPHVVRARPGARLTVVGTGPLQDLATEMAARRPEVTLVVDPPRGDVHRALRSAAVLVLLSQPTLTWREQVGLPLVEGLAHGCTVVTTAETGLADWLAAHGHTVLAPDAAPAAVASAVVAALAARRPAASVLADLPSDDGRQAAEVWLSRPAA